MMLKIHNCLSSLKYMQLMDVYSEESADDREAILGAEQELYSYLQLFFQSEGAFVAIWEEEGQYCSALRIEPWQDGYLLSGLATALRYRRKGYGASLVEGVLAQLPAGSKVYSHIENGNFASIALHGKCGFSKQKDYACMLDGSVSHHLATFYYEKQNVYTDV